MEEFKKLGLSEQSIAALEKKGFTTPTSIQAQAIPLLLKGEKDVVGQSQTGTGKTAGFALPIIERIDENSRTVQAIILTPTRELALQVSEEINSLKGNKKIQVLAVYGGSPIGPQRDKLKRGVDIVVGTPGRVMDLQKRRSLNLDNIKYAVLDEADEMLNMGFVEDIEAILKNTPKEKSMLLFSATMPKQILRIAKKYMREYELIEIEKANVTTSTVEQIYFNINAKDRLEGLRRIIDYYMDFYGIIFCNTKSAVDTLTRQLTKLNYGAAALHGDITQGQREKILLQFKNKTVKILVATDVAARGIDVNDLSHVINFSLPQSPESYVHRIGRTGRAGKKGISITFVIPSEQGKLRFVERTNNIRLTKATLPSPKQIVENKEVQIKEVIENILKVGKTDKFETLASELLHDNKPMDVIQAILKYNFNNQLDAKSYKDISDSKPERVSSYKTNFRRGRGSSQRFSGNRNSRGSGDKPRGRFTKSRSDKKPEGRFSKNKSGDSPRSRFSKKGSDDKPGNRFSKGKSDSGSEPRFSKKRFDNDKSDKSFSKKKRFSKSSEKKKEWHKNSNAKRKRD